MNYLSLVRIVVGGLLAGFLINCGEYLLSIVAFEDQSGPDMCGLHLHVLGQPAGPLFDVAGLMVGVIGMGILVAIERHFRRTSTAALVTGVILWIPAGLLSLLIPAVAGLTHWGEVWVNLAWMLIEIPLGILTAVLLFDLVTQRDRRCPSHN